MRDSKHKGPRGIGQPAGALRRNGLENPRIRAVRAMDAVPDRNAGASGTIRGAGDFAQRRSEFPAQPVARSVNVERKRLAGAELKAVAKEIKRHWGPARWMP